MASSGPEPRMAGEAALERLLRRDRLIAATGLALLCALAWLHVATGAGLGMSAAAMTSLTLFPHRLAGMAMAAAPWPWATWALMLAMWWTMMVAMMAPSAAPTILLHARVHRHAQATGGDARPAPSGAFAAGYLLVWLGFSVAATLIYWLLERGGLVAAMSMGSGSRWLSAGLLGAAGLFQLSPLKQNCLAHCRSPASFLARHWRPGTIGALRLGALHGGFCLGCCWLLMALLFVGGVMNLAWIAALTLFVLAEKTLPGGRWLGRAAGIALMLWGVATLLV